LSVASIVADPEGHGVECRSEEIEQLAQGGFIAFGDPAGKLAFSD
jgi:hypothetical protein